MAQTIIYILFSLPSLAILIATVVLNFRGNCSVMIKRSMSAMLIVVALSMLCYAQYYNPYLAARYSWGFDFVYSLITPFCAPLYYLFINCLTDIKRRPVINVLMFLPAIIYMVLLILAQALLNGAERHAYMSSEIMGQDIQMESSVAYSLMLLVGKKIFDIFMPCQSIFVMIYGEFRFNTYISMLRRYSSARQTETTIRMRGIHVMTVLVVVTGLIMSAIPIYESTDHLLLVAIAVTGQIVMVSMVVSYVMQLEVTAEDIHVMTEEEPIVPVRPTIMSAPSPIVHHEPVKVQPMPTSLMERIDMVMENERLYLQPDLTLISLCERVGTNRTYASKAIKDAKGCNFSDYVNRYRLAYALDILKQTPKEDIVIQNIASQCGCGSIQTFYRYFKLFYNETPTQWLERNK